MLTSSKGEGVNKWMGSSDISGRESGLASPPSSLAIGDRSHHRDERDRTCHIGRCHNDNKRSGASGRGGVGWRRASGKGLRRVASGMGYRDSLVRAA